MAIRKDANTLSSAERTELVSALLQLKAEGIYDQFVLRHANANMMAIHRCPAFLPWHRRFLWDLEKELQRVSGNPNLGVPYWNWPEGGADASMWNDDLLGGDGDAGGTVRSGPFRSGRWVVVDSSDRAAGPLERGFGRNTNGVGLPTRSAIEEMLQITPYDTSPWNTNSSPSFRNTLEGFSGGLSFHNLGHVWVGGSMLPMTSPNDPVFFFHHCMVDKLWHEWQLRFPAQGYLPVTGGGMGQNLTATMDSTPFAAIGRRPIDVLDSSALDIVYDDAVPPVVVEPPVIIEPPVTGDVDLSLNTAATSGNIGVAGEVDQYRFDVASFNEVTIETSGNSDTFITLFGPNDATDLIEQNDDGGDNLNSKITLNLSAGTYYVSVRLYSPTATGGYAIQASSESDSGDGNGGSSLPELIVDAAEISAAISSRNESDVYRFRVIRRAFYTIETTGSTDTFLSLSGPDDETLSIEQDDDSGASLNSRIRRILTAGEYYARIRHFSPDGTGGYSISVKKR